MRKILFICSILLICCSAREPVSAQKQWSLEECIEYALKNNLQVKQQRLNLQLQEYTLLQSKAALLPMINANASHGYNYGRTVDRFTNQFATQEVQYDNFYLQGSITLFNGFTMLNTIVKNRHLLEAGKYAVEKMQNDISLNIASGYLNILFNQELLANAAGQLEITQQQVERTRKVVDVGALSKGNLLNIEAQAASEELSVVNARNQLELSYLILAQLLDMSSAEGFDIQKPAITIPDSPKLAALPEQIYNIAVDFQPQIKSAEHQVKAAERDLSVARGNISPTLTLAGSYGTGYSGASQQIKSMSATLDTIGFTAVTQELVLQPSWSFEYEKKPFDEQIEDNINKSIGFNLSIPIFNGLSTRTNISRARIGIENARLNLEIEKKQLLQDVQRAYADALAALNKYGASRKSVEAMEEAFRYTQQKFEVGLINSVDYNEAKKNLNRSQSELLQAKYEFVFKRTILDFYMGKPIMIN